MNNLKVISQNGQLVVTSRQIAEDFEKEHNDTKKRIRDLAKDMGEISHTYFMITNYIDSMNRPQEEYLITKDGFSLLVMGFTGSKALEWKLKYIQAFNEMEQSLKAKQLPLSKELQAIFAIDKRTMEFENRMDSLESNMPLFNVECKELQALVKKTGTKALGGYKSPAYTNNSLRGLVYSDIQCQLRREFGVERYEAIKRSLLDTAKKIVIEYNPPTVLVNKILLINNQISM